MVRGRGVVRVCSVPRGRSMLTGCSMVRVCSVVRAAASGLTTARLLSCGMELNSAGTLTGGVVAAMRPSSLDRSASAEFCTCNHHMCQRLQP